MARREKIKDNLRNKAPGWQRIKKVVDMIFSDTEKDRDKMSHHLTQFKGLMWREDGDDYDGLHEANYSYGEDDLKKSRIMYNMLFSIVETIAPMLTDSNPITNLIPNWPQFEALANRYNMGLKYFWQSTEMQNQLYKAAIFALVTGTAIFKIEFNPEKKFGGDIDTVVIDPRDFFIAPGYEDEWEAPYCGTKKTVPIYTIKKRFGQDLDIKAETDKFKSTYNKRSTPDSKYGESTSNFQNSLGMATMYEVWCSGEFYAEFAEKEVEDDEGKKKKVKELKYPNGVTLFFTKDKLLGVEESDADHGLPPYVKLVDYLDPTNFLGMGEAHQIDGLNKELQLQLRALVDYSRKFHDFDYEIDVDRLSMDPEAAKNMLKRSGQVYATRGAFTQGGEAIRQIKLEPIGSEVMNLIAMLPRMIEEISGVTDTSKGVAAKKERQSASEVAMLLESSHTRTRQRVRNFEHTLKRICYIIVRLMQQYYTEPRTIHFQQDDGVLYSTLGNSRAQAENITLGGQTPADATNYAMASDEEKNKVPPKERQAYEDYLKLVESFDSEGEADPVYFKFEVVIQTNSTLPLDKQSLANLMLRLFQLEAVDAEAILDILQIPNRQEILSRVEKQQQEQQKPPGGAPAGPPQGGPPGIPTELNPGGQ